MSSFSELLSRSAVCALLDVAVCVPLVRAFFFPGGFTVLAPSAAVKSACCGKQRVGRIYPEFKKYYF